MATESTDQISRFITVEANCSEKSLYIVASIGGPWEGQPTPPPKKKSEKALLLQW